MSKKNKHNLTKDLECPMCEHKVFRAISTIEVPVEYSKGLKRFVLDVQELNDSEVIDTWLYSVDEIRKDAVIRCAGCGTMFNSDGTLINNHLIKKEKED